MDALYVFADVQHDAGEEVEDERETYCQERRVDKKQADFVDGDVEFFAQVGAYPEGVTLEKSDDPLQHNQAVFSILFPTPQLRHFL